VPLGLTTELEKMFIDEILSADLYQVNFLPNSNCKFLDLIFCNCIEHFEILAANNLLTHNEIHHTAMEIILKIDKPLINSINSGTSKLDFSRVNFDFLCESLDIINWDQVLDTTDLDLMVERFYGIVGQIISDNVPTRRSRCYSHPPWYDRNLRNLKNKCNKAY